MADKMQGTTAPDTGQGSDEKNALEQGKFSPFAALATIKSQVRVLEVPAPVPAGTPATVVDTSTSAEAEVARTPDEDAVLFVEAKALARWVKIDKGIMKVSDDPTIVIDPQASGETAKTRFTPPKAPEGVSRDIGELLGLLGAKNVELPKRYWFYVNRDGKCGTATLKVVRTKGELAVIVVAVEGDVPQYLMDLRMGEYVVDKRRDVVITLAALVHPKDLGSDELSQKVKQLARELADICRRMARARSRNRRHESAAKQETQQS